MLQLKDMFPGFRLALPPKRWFKDNYDSSFLEDRQLGLQAFLQNLIAHKDIANWYAADFRRFTSKCAASERPGSSCWLVNITAIVGDGGDGGRLTWLQNQL